MLKKISPFIIDETTLSGRVEGARVRDTILKKLEGEAPDIILPLDLSKVKFIDFSFTDEMLGRLLRRILSGELGEKYVILVGLSDSLRESIGVSLKERELVCVFENSNSQIEIIGKLSEELKSTYLFAVNNGRITARDVLDSSDVMQNISAASNRLTRLKDLGLLTKSKDEVVAGGGRQFIYEPIR